VYVFWGGMEVAWGGRMHAALCALLVWECGVVSGCQAVNATCVLMRCLLIFAPVCACRLL
jgi:hypothetical protein